jgi:hypothetical protein
MAGCDVAVVCLGREAVTDGIAVGREIEIVGALTERRWKGRGGVRQSRFEILARTIRVL